MDGFEAPPRRIATERLVLRPYERSDAPLVKDAVDSSLEHLRGFMDWAWEAPEPVEIVASDLAARCWQHEIDHLNGVMFIDKMGPIARLASRTRLKEFEHEFKKAQERGEIPQETDIEKLLLALEGKA